MPITPVRVGEARLDAAHVAAFAAGDTVAVDPVPGHAGLDRVRRGQAALVAARDRGAVYGLTTGVGALRHVAVEPVEPGGPGAIAHEGDAGHALRLWRSHAAGVGPELDDETARATMLVRLHQLLLGGSGVSPELVQALAEALASGAVPRLHRHGGIGTGDLTVLAQLGLTLTGELPWRTAPVCTNGTGAGPGIGLARVVDGDALPFVSSNAMTAGVGSLAITRLARLARAAEQVCALSHLALRGSRQAYDARVHAAKDDPHAAAVAARLRGLVGEQDPPAARIQDPFCLRTVPQVHAPLEEALVAAERALSAEIGAAAENPLAVAPSGSSDGSSDGATALHHGQFVTQRLAAGLDGVRAAAVPVLTLSMARLGALLDPELTGLRSFLAGGPSGSSGLMILEYVAADLRAQSLALATPVTGSRTMVSLGLEEHASHSTQAAWACRDLVDLVPNLLACELVAAVRALRLDPARAGTGPAADLFGRADAALPDVPADHVLGPDLDAAAALVRQLG